VVPRPYSIEPFSNGAFSALRVRAQRAEDVLDFCTSRSAGQVHGRDTMPVKAVREIPEQGILWIGRHGFDHEPVLSHTESDGVPVAEQGV
jgi:hypothetical protein